MVIYIYASFSKKMTSSISVINISYPGVLTSLLLSKIMVFGSLTVVSNFSLTKSLKTLIISILLSFFIVKFVKINVLIWANVCYNRHRR